MINNYFTVLLWWFWEKILMTLVDLTKITLEKWNFPSFWNSIPTISNEGVILITNGIKTDLMDPIKESWLLIRQMSLKTPFGIVI